MSDRDPYTFVNHEHVPHSILRVVTGVLKSWDMTVSDYEYVNCFHPDGVLHLGPDPTEGREALRKAHDFVIHPEKGPVVNSQHYVDRIFTLPGASSEKVEVVITGAHDNTMRDGALVKMDFASWVVMTKGVDEGWELQAEYWRVFQDQRDLSAAMNNL